MKNVAFERIKFVDEENFDLGAVTNSGSSFIEDTITISGCVIKLEP